MNGENELEGLIEIIKKDRKVRTAICRKSHLLFFYVYLSNYVRHPIAPFHREMFAITEDVNIKNAVIIAFRNSAKSTLMTYSYPIWSILGQQQKKFILIASQTRVQARQHLMNIKRELEDNDLLRADLGPFETQNDEWGSYALVIKKYGAKIMAVSTEQSIRGLRHREYRPDLILLDDIEDTASTKTKEGRDKTHEWLTSEVIPAGDQNTKIIIVGNLLHEDSLLMRLKQLIEEEKFNGIFRTYPLIDEHGNITWSGKFSNLEAIEELRMSIGDERSWKREFLLVLVPACDQIILKEWIQYYDMMPRFDSKDYVGTFISIDPAISEKEEASNTAMVAASIFGYDDDMKIYIHPFPVNEKLTFFETKQRAKLLSRTMGRGVKLLVEDVGYQKALIQDLKREGLLVEEFKVYGMDKQARLTIAAGPVQSSKVFFPKHGFEELVQQIVGFGVEKRKDLADAFSMVIMKAVEIKKPSFPEVFTVSFGRNDD